MAMGHAVQDARDAIARAKASYRDGWHPILAAVETTAGEWLMVPQDGDPYAVIRILTRGDETGYRAVTWAATSEDRKLIGYYRTLRGAAFAAHSRWIAGHAKPGGVNGL